VRLLYLVKKEFIEIFRQREILPFIFVSPIIQIVLFGYVVTTDIKNVPVEIVNYSNSATAERIIRRINSSPLFNVKKISASEVDPKIVLKKGKLSAVILFRDSGSGNLTSSIPEVQVLMDGVDSNTSSLAAGYVAGIIRRYFLEELKNMGIKMPVENRTLIRFNPELKSINYMGPGIVALLLTILSLFLTSLSIVREKVQQTMDTLLVSRLSPVEIYVGKAMPMMLIGIFNMIVGTAVVVLWFGIPVRGNMIYMLITAIIFLCALLSYALFISTVASTEQQALFFSWFSMVTFIMLAGLFTPVENIPAAVRFFSDIDPVRYLIKIIREIFIKGNGITYFYKDLIILAGIAAVVLSVSLFNFRRLVRK